MIQSQAETNRLLQVFMVAIAANMGLLLCIDAANAQTARLEQPIIGTVKLKREGWSKFQPVDAGTALGQRDQLLPGKGAKVTVVCPDLSKRRVPVNVPSGLKSICPVWLVGARDRREPAPGTLGGINASIPYIISPRHTLLLSATPLLQWNPVAGATQYTAKLTNRSGFKWEKQVAETQVAVKETLPLASPYLLTVQTSTGKASQDEGSSNLDFFVLRPAEAAIVQAEVAKINQQKLSRLNTALQLASLYSNYVLPATTISAYGLSTQASKTYSLTSEAITTMESLIKAGEQPAIAYRTLGDLYWQSGLAQLAIDHYSKAVDIAKQPEELEEKTLAQLGLGEVYAAINDIPQAKRFYGQAIEGYLSLGYNERANLLKQQLENLE